MNFTKKTVKNTKSTEIDLATETDQRIEKMIIDTLKKEFPIHKFIGEESVAAGDKCTLTDDPTWIIDPIDGTTNFVHNFPHCCISLALFVNGEPNIGIIFNSVLDQLFTARKGKGAFLNGQRISVSGETEMSKSLLIVECGSSRDPEKLKTSVENYQNLIPLITG